MGRIGPGDLDGDSRSAHRRFPQALLTDKVTKGHVDKHVILGKSHFGPVTRALSGGDGIRTHGLYIANLALCQLSYTPDERTG